jgi:hypothetical protein
MRHTKRQAGNFVHQRAGRDCQCVIAQPPPGCGDDLSRRTIDAYPGGGGKK